jgi:AcrR family transcriptional regulator
VCQTTHRATAGYDGAVSDSSPTVGLRERKKQRTEQAIRDAALRLVAARGFDNVTADDIAAEVEIGKSTFYRYFESKEDALLGKPTEELQKMQAALDARPADEPVLIAVRNAIMDYADTVDHDREMVLLKGRIMRDNPQLEVRNLAHQAMWEALLAEFVASRLGDEPDTELRSRVVAAIVMATLRATLVYWRDSGGADDLHELMGTSLTMLAERRTAFVTRP